MWPKRAALVATSAVVASLLTAPVRSSAQVQDRSELIAALDSAAAAHAADSMVAGVAVAVVRDGETLLLEGYGQANREFDVPTPPDAVYEVGSITKQFTAAAILQLAARDSLDLDAEMTEYLPDYDTRGHAVTVRQLLHHTSGIRDYFRMSAVGPINRTDVPRDTILSLVEAEPFRFAPGTNMSYSNTGYFLLGLIIEATSGQPYDEYLDEHLLGPAGMADSHYCDERAVVDHGAQGYSWDDQGRLQRRQYFDHTWPFAAGSLCSTAGDLLAWNQALHGGRVLSDSMYRAMITPGQLADGTELRYAMGLVVLDMAGHRVIRHGGGVYGFLSESRYYPHDELIVVVLQNTTGPKDPQALADSLSRLVLGPKEEVESSPYDGDLSEFAGRYVGPSPAGLTDIRITVDDGELVARMVGSDEEGDRLQHVFGLKWRHGTDEYRFVRAGERIIRLRLDVGGGHYVLRRVEER